MTDSYSTSQSQDTEYAAKRPDSLGELMVDCLRAGGQAAGTVGGGIISAVGVGVRGYTDALADERLRRAPDSGLIQSALLGWACYFEELARTARRASQEIGGARLEPDSPEPVTCE